MCKLTRRQRYLQSQMDAFKNVSRPDTVEGQMVCTQTGKSTSTTWTKIESGKNYRKRDKKKELGLKMLHGWHGKPEYVD